MHPTMLRHALIVLLLPAHALAMPYDREALLELTIQRNPEIRAAAAEARALEGRLRQSQLYPNPELELEQDELRWGEGEGMTGASIGQPIVLGKRRQRARDLALAERELAQRSLRQTVRTVLAKVDRLHVRVAYHHADISSQYELLEEAERSLEQATTTTGGLDGFKARIERDRIQLELTRHSAELVYTLQELGVMTGGTAFRAEQIAGELTLDFPMLHDTPALLEQHPLVLVAEGTAKVESLRGRLLRAERVPDVTVMAGAGWREETDEAVPFAGLRIPLPLWNRNQGSIQEAHTRTVGLDARSEQVRLEVANAIRFNAQQLNEFHTFASEYHDSILPAAQGALKDARRRLAEGSARPLDVLDSQRVLTEARSTCFQYLLRFNTLLAERRGIEGYKQEADLDAIIHPKR